MNKAFFLKYAIFPITICMLAVTLIAKPRTLQVGPGASYKMPCQAFKEALDGDIIEIDAAGNYKGDVCRISASNLTIRGIEGRARIYAAGRDSEGKAIWVIGGNNTVIENIELSGCRVSDKNGAGIRQEGANLIVRNCYFHDNENGILSGKNPASTILIENTEFAGNGYGDGYSHNIYIGSIRKLIMRFCYSHHAHVGHLIKSRAAENHILYNRLTGEGESSYELNLPNGGNAYVVGNIFQQSPATKNDAILAFGEEGALPSSRLLVINNTFINDHGSGLFVKVNRVIDTRTVIVNNIFAGPGQVCSQKRARLSSNYIGADPGFLGRTGLDWRLKHNSPCLNAGTDPKELGIEAVIPKYEYVHPCRMKPRASAGQIDIGAFEKSPL